MEIISGVERHRRWRREEELKTAAPAESARIEIALPDGTCIRVGADVGLATLRRVITAVRR